MTREASQPQMSGGKMSARGGTSHKGMLNTKANRATTVHPKDQTKPCHHAEAAPRRTKSGKRRCATKVTKVGVSIQATNSKDATTITGTAKVTTMSGATTDLNESAPMACNHWRKADIKAHCSSPWRTLKTAGSQYSQPKPKTPPPTKTKGSCDHKMTRGCKQ